MNLNEIGYSTFFHVGEQVNSVGRVSFVGRSSYKIIMEDGEYNGILKGNLMYNTADQSDYPTVGDWVDVRKIDNDKVIILKKFERYNCISRKVNGVKIKEQILASNIDNVFICLSLNDNFNINRLERYLFALSSSVNPVIILTKKDLTDNYREYYQKVKERYSNLDVKCVSSLNKDFDGLVDYFQYGTTSVLIGSSGVGKSTLINSIFNKELMAIGEINERNDKGRHTTSFRQLIYLGSGRGCIIDTPGMRELSIWDSDEGNSSFTDIIDLAKKCKYRNCKHINEEGCAIKSAIQDGTLFVDRYNNYLKLVAEYKFIDSKKNYFTRKESNEKIKKRCESKRK